MFKYNFSEYFYYADSKIYLNLKTVQIKNVEIFKIVYINKNLKFEQRTNFEKHLDFEFVHI